jgi:HTH-type transcriptional regulator/antitoxin HigA
MAKRSEVATIELRPIRTKREYQAALKQAEALWNAPQGTPEADRLEAIALLSRRTC